MHIGHAGTRLQQTRGAALRGAVLLGITLSGLVGSLAAQQGTPAQGQQPQGTGTQQPAGPQPQMVEAGPGLGRAASYIGMVAEPPAVKVPEGFTPIFNGRDLTGWHISKTARHGITPEFRVVHGVIIGTQQPYGSGGLLITDKKYRNFELYMEVNPDWGADSGIFFRTTEEGAAYQITMDYLQNGFMGRVIGEGGLVGVGRPVGQETAPMTPPGQGAQAGQAATPRPPDPGMSAWKKDDWNSIRVRVEGDAPHVTVWVNDQQVTDFTDPANRAAGGMVEGPIAIQVHGGPQRWAPGAFWRWRNIGIRELPAR